MDRHLTIHGGWMVAVGSYLAALLLNRPDRPYDRTACGREDLARDDWP